MTAAPKNPDRLHGILPVLATPFGNDASSLDSNDATKHVAEDDMVRIVDFVIEAGAHGIVFPGVASECNFLSTDERRRLCALVGERVDGRIPIVVGASADSVDEVINLAQCGMEYGATAAMIMAPAELGAAPRPLISFYDRIAKATGIDIILQNAPPPVGSGLSVETLAEIVAAVRRIRYIKEETLPSGQRISRLLDKAPGHLMGIMGGGGARYVIDELSRGACGAMPACELTDIHVALFNAFQAQTLDKARSLYNRTLPLLLFQAVFRMRMTKAVLRQRGIIAHGEVRAPLPELDDQDRHELLTMLSEVDDLLTVRWP